MSKIPYFFETPVPKYFRESGLFKNENTFKFVTWAFSRCQSVPHTEYLDNYKKVLLQPFEFVAGRLSSPAECFMTESAFRVQLNNLQKAGFLKKTTNSVTNQYSCYIWVTERFSKDSDQRNDQRMTNATTNEQPQIRDQSLKNPRSKESHQSPSVPSSKKKEEGMTDDFFSDEEKGGADHEAKKTPVKTQPIAIKAYPSISEKQITLPIPGVQHNINYQLILPETIYQECISIKGSIESLVNSVRYILNHPKRVAEILDWPNTLRKWKIKNDLKPRLEENETLTKSLVKQFGNTMHQGWICQEHRDKLKDCKGIIFFNNASTGTYAEVFIQYTDPEFKEKCDKVMIERRMKKAPP